MDPCNSLTDQWLRFDHDRLIKLHGFHELSIERNLVPVSLNTNPHERLGALKCNLSNFKFKQNLLKWLKQSFLEIPSKIWVLVPKVVCHVNRESIKLSKTYNFVNSLIRV